MSEPKLTPLERELLAMLERHQWVEGWCPECGEPRVYGHGECRLANVIAKAKGEAE